ncbi:MAG: substrate-binding domain-containing protein, partial [Ilumatobacteraceae bacterium]
MSAMTSRRGVIRTAVIVGLAASLALAACGSSKKAATPAATNATGTAAGSTSGGTSGGTVGVSLILKNTSNAFFVSMQKSAQEAASAMGVSLTVAAGKEDGDTATQIAAVEAAVARGDKGILITPSGDAVVPSLDAARKAGLLVIALDTPPNPATAVDITFATDNYNAGQLIGKWTAGQ